MCRLNGVVLWTCLRASLKSSSWRCGGKVSWGLRWLCVKRMGHAAQTRVEAIRLAQAHYPERLGLAVVAHPPLLFWALWKSLQPFLDPVTKCVPPLQAASDAYKIVPTWMVPVTHAVSMLVCVNPHQTLPS